MSKINFFIGKAMPILKISGNGVRDFHQQWCRMHRWRVDWEQMAKPCENQMAWEQRPKSSEWKTDARSSFIVKLEIQPAGQFSRFFIQSVTKNGVMKGFGGDAWRVYMRQGPASLAPQVWDHDNGQYEVLFLPIEPGYYSAQIILDFTLCDGLREPPVDWFIRGTIQGKYQPHGILGYIADDYILEPLGGQTTVTFFIPERADNIGVSPTAEAPSCGIPCFLLQDGFGRWVNDQWLPYLQDYIPPDETRTLTPAADTLLIYGDSVAKQFFESVTKRRICERYFKQCEYSYLWIYELTSINDAKSKFVPNDFDATIILDYMASVLDSPGLKHQNSLFLFNLGVHYHISINFTTFKDLIDNVVKLINNKVLQKGENVTIFPVWKTATSIEREKAHKLYPERLPTNVTHWRFHTHQRLELFSKYATSAMCKAGIPVLDVYPMTFAYPDGTYDHVHYAPNAQRPAEDQLLTFVEQKMRRRQRGNAQELGYP